MTAIDVPDGQGTLKDRLWDMHPVLGGPAQDLTRAVYGPLRLSVREREAARRRIAQINDCLACLDMRPLGMERHGLGEDFYKHVGEAPEHPDLYSDSERLAIEYAERFALDHRGIGPAFFERLRAAFDDVEVLELTTVVARHLAFGRLTRVLQMYGDACDVPLPGAPGPYDA